MVCAFGKLGAELLYGVSARDPLVLGTVAGFLFVVSLLAAFGRRGPPRAEIRSDRFG